MKTKILYVLTRPPFPASDGTRERILGELQALNQDFNIDLLIISDEDVKISTIEKLNQIGITDITVFKLKKINRYRRSLFSLFSKYPLQSAYFYNPKAYRWLEKHAANYAVVHFHTLRFGFYIESLKNKKICPNTRLLLCFNDAISLNYHNAGQKAKGLWQIIYKIETDRIKKYEIKLLTIADGFSIVSARDRDYILNNWQNIYPKLKIPTINIIRHGINDALFAYNYRPQNNNLVFIGNLMYPPNCQGLSFFCRKIWPEILKQKPSSKLIIIGRGGEKIFDRYPGIEALGFIENPYLLMTRQAMFISPADFGAGVPTKSLLAMALGLPVISTANNAAGIEEVTDGKNICLIDYQKSQLAAGKIIAALNDEVYRKKIGTGGKELVNKKYKQSNNYFFLKTFITNK